MVKRQCAGWIFALAAMGLLASCSPQAKESRFLERADRFYSQKKYAEAVIEYMNVLRLDNSNHVAIERIGLAQFAEGNLQEAYPFIAKAVEQQPGNADLGTKLARIYLLSGSAKEARDASDKVMQSNPTNFEALMVWSSASVSREFLDENLKRLKAAGDEFGKRARYHVALGSVYARKGMRDAAEPEFTKAVELDPKSADAQTALADFDMLKGDMKAAGEHYQAAVALAPIDSEARLKWSGYKLQTGDAKEARRILEEITQKKPDYLPAWYGLAEFDFADGKYDDCLALVAKILKKEPRHIQALLLRGRTRLARGDVDKAIDEYEGLISSYPAYAPLHYQLGLALVKKGNVPQAIDELKKAVDLDPEFVDAGFAMAELDIRTGKSGAAIEYLQSLVKLNPNLARAYVMLGTAYRENGMPDRAIAAYNKLFELQPTSPQGPYMKGLVLRKLGKRDEARKSLEAAVALAPDFVNPLATLASMDIEDKDVDGALARIRKQIGLKPDNAELHYMLGRVCMIKGDKDDAEQAMLKAIELQPRLSAAYIDLGRIYASSGKRDAALQKMEQALAVNSNNVGALMMAGIIYQEITDFKKARSYYERILAVNPMFAPAANNLAYILSEQMGDWDHALDLAKQARESAPHDPYTADTLGWIFYHQGDYKAASSLLQESADELPEEQEVQYHFAVARCALGDEASALDSLKLALKEPRDFDGRADASNLLAVLSIGLDTASSSDTAVLEAALTNNPKNAAVLLRLALASQRSGDEKKAQKYFEDAVNANPSYVPALACFAEFSADILHDKAKALELAKNARELLPSDPQIIETLGWVAYQSGDFAWAASLLGDIAAKLPADAVAQYRAGLVLYSIGRVDEAEQAAQGALNISSNFQDAADATLFVKMLDLAKLASSNGDAMAQADAVLKDRPAYVPALAVRAAALDGAHDAKASRAAYEKILSLYPDFTPAVLRLASIYADDRVSDDPAFKLAQRARELRPDDAAVAGALGIIFYLRGQYDRAVQLLAECAGKQRDNADVQFYLGMAQYKQKNTSAAKTALNRALELEPTFRYADEARKTLAEIK